MTLLGPSRRRGRLAVAIVVSTLLLSMSSLLAQGQTVTTATLKVSKSITGVSIDNVATFKVTVENNGTIPVFDVQIYEYINPSLTPKSAIMITSPSGNAVVPLSTGGVATAVQVIVDPPAPASLAPGQSLALEYRMYAPNAGDFQVPSDLVWFSYMRGASTLRANYYSNGLLLHVPNGYEKVIIMVFPYVVSVTTFAVTATILFWARRRLQMVKKRRSELSRR